MSEIVEKRPVGRPTKYNPVMCDRVISLGLEGASITEMAFELGIDKTTLYDWLESNPEFSNAVKQAHSASQTWWEKEGRRGIWGGKAFNATTWIFNMKNRFRDDWADRTEVEHSGQVALPVINLNIAQQQMAAPLDAEYEIIEDITDS